MECPSCGKIIPDESVYCLYCGEKLAPADQPGGGQQEWEYQDVFLSNEDFAKKEKLILRNREEPIPSDIEKLWSIYFPQINDLLQPQIQEQWSLDPACLEPECILYEIRSQTFQDYTRGDWIWTGILTVLSAGIYLLFIQLVNRSNQIIEPKGVQLKLRREIIRGA
jgi:hypothetical protein